MSFRDQRASSSLLPHARSLRAPGVLRLIASCLAPLAVLTLSVCEHLRASRDPDSVADGRLERFPLGVATIGFGLFLALSGAVNQLIRHPPLSVDLTLRTGNGGFVVLGAALILTGWLMTRRSIEPHR